MSGRPYDPKSGGPRGLKGSETVRQAFADINTVIDRNEIDTRIQAERTNRVDPKLKKRTQDEFDICYNEYLITPIRTGYADGEEVHDIPVTSTVAGIKDKNIKRALDNYQPAGISMTRIVHIPENSTVVTPQRKLASQIHGTWTGDSFHEDMPFGALCRLEPNANPRSSHGYLGTNKLRLVVKPETDGKPFSMRMQERMYDYFNGNTPYVPDNEKTKVDLAMEDMFEAFTNMVAVVHATHANLKSFIQAEKDNQLEIADYLLNLHPDKQKCKMYRQKAMQFIFAGMNATVTKANPKLLYGGEFQPTTTDTGKIQKMQLEASAFFFEKMMDAMRLDNMWVVGKVIRPTQAPGKFDAMLI